MKAKILVGLIFAFLFINVVYGLNVFVKQEPIKFKGYPGGELSYNISILNKETNPVTLSLNFLYATPEFSENPITLQPNEQKIIKMSFKIPYGVSYGTSYQRVLFFDEKGSRYDILLLIPVTVLEPKNVYENAYIKNLRTTPYPVDPRKPFSLKFDIFNPADDINVNVKITSEILSSSTTLLVKKGEHEFEISNLTLDSKINPGKYPINVEVQFPGKNIVQNDTIVVGGYSNCKVEKSFLETIFYKKFTAKIYNNGTEQTTCTVSEPLGGIAKLLLTNATQGYVFEDGKIKWEVIVGPKETIYVNYKLDYSALIAAPFVVIIFALAFWYFTRQVDVRKELVTAKSRPGFMDFQIQIRVRNLTNKELTKVKIKDPLPAVTKEIRGYGTIAGKVKKEKGQKYVVWEVDELKPKEERVFSYKFRTSIEVVGKLLLLPTVIKYKDVSGRSREASSNLLSVEVE